MRRSVGQLIDSSYEQRKKKRSSKNGISSTQLNGKANKGSLIQGKRRGLLDEVENPVGEAGAGVEEVEEQVEEQETSLVRNLRRTPPSQQQKKRTKTARWRWIPEAV